MTRKGLTLSGLTLVAINTFFFSSLSWAEDFLGNGQVKALYDKHCASCHGKHLEGAMATSLLDDQWVTSGSDQDLADAIKFGLKDASMPAWKAVLTDDEIRTLVLLIRERSHLAKNKGSAVKALNEEQVFQSEHHNFTLTTVAEGNALIWGFDFLPDNKIIFTQRNGELWVQDGDKKVRIKNSPEVWHQDQGGLLDVAAHPEFEKNGWIYLSYSIKTGKNNEGKEVGSTAIVRGKIHNQTWTENQIIYLPDPSTHVNRGWHFGSRFALTDEHIYFSIGDEGYMASAQSLQIHSGKIHRLNLDGSIPKDNPFVNTPDALPSLWTYGNRNPQGMTIDPQSGQVWSAEHGPRGGDEINRVTKGSNYGWPLTTFGMNYDGTSMNVPTSLADTIAPVHQWTPSIAVSNITFYSGAVFPEWKGNMFAGSLAFQQLRRVVLKDNQFVKDEVILSGLGRIRDVATGPNGKLYVTLNNNETHRFRIVTLSPSAH